jgi:hypothetical protein
MYMYPPVYVTLIASLLFVFSAVAVMALILFH